MKFSEIFATETCTRCGGSGRYSYCTMHGDRCFKCSGRGVQFTKKSAPLVEDFMAAQKASKSVLIGDEPGYLKLEVGMKLKHPDGSKEFVNEAGQRRIPFVTVTEIEETQVSEGRMKPGRYLLHLSDGTTFPWGEFGILSRVATAEEILSLCKLPKTVEAYRAAQAKADSQKAE